eukprot:6111700-Pyramimonas_sp.AAC.3
MSLSPSLMAALGGLLTPTQAQAAAGKWEEPPHDDPPALKQAGRFDADPSAPRKECFWTNRARAGSIFPDRGPIATRPADMWMSWAHAGSSADYCRLMVVEVGR